MTMSISVRVMCLVYYAGADNVHHGMPAVLPGCLAVAVQEQCRSNTRNSSVAHTALTCRGFYCKRKGACIPLLVSGHHRRARQVRSCMWRLGCRCCAVWLLSVCCQSSCSETLHLPPKVTEAAVASWERTAVAAAAKETCRQEAGGQQVAARLLIAFHMTYQGQQGLLHCM